MLKHIQFPMLLNISWTTFWLAILYLYAVFHLIITQVYTWWQLFLLICFVFISHMLNNFGWDGWMASLTQLTWVWVNPGSWWWTGRPGMLQSMGLQRVGHNWVTELTDWLTEKLIIRQGEYIHNRKNKGFISNILNKLLHIK